MKKLISALFIVLCVSVSMIIPASAQAATNNVTLIAAKSESTVTVTLSVSEARKGVQAVIDFDSTKLTYASAEILNSTLSAYNTVESSVKATETGIRIMLVSKTAVSGGLIKLSFTVKDDAVGKADFTVKDLMTVDSNNTVTKDTAGSASVAITMPGDINGDGVVDVRDLVRIKKYFAKATTDIVVKNSDLDGNGSVENADMVILRKGLINGTL